MYFWNDSAMKQLGRVCFVLQFLVKSIQIYEGITSFRGWGMGWGGISLTGKYNKENDEWVSMNINIILKENSKMIQLHVFIKLYLFNVLYLNKYFSAVVK